MRRLCTLVLALLLLCGCAEEPVSDTSEPEPAAEPGTCGLAYYTGEPVSPVLTVSRLDRLLVEALFEGLFELDNSFTPVPVLCESWTTDGLTYTLTLKEGVTFWSGAPLTAADAAATYRLAQTEPGSPYYGRFRDVTAIEALDERTLSLTLNAPNARFLSLLDVPICRAGTERESFAEGTGPYRPSEEGSGWVLLPNERWHQGRADAFSRITLTATGRAETLEHGFETGDVSMARIERISTEGTAVGGSINVYQTRTADFHYLGVNFANTWLSRPAVRQALHLLLPRESVCAVPLQDYADPAVLPVNPQPPGTRLTGDSDWSAALLAKAGLADTDGDGLFDVLPIVPRWSRTPAVPVPIELSLLVNSENSFKVAAAQSIAAAFQAAGLQTVVRALPYADYRAALEAGEFDLYYGETLLTPDFDLRPLTAAGGALNYGGFADPVYEAALSAGRAADDQTAFYEEFVQVLPVIPIAFERNQVVTRAGLLEHFAPRPYDLFAGAEHWAHNTQRRERP